MARVFSVLILATLLSVGLAYVFAGCSSEDPPLPLVDAAHVARAVPLDVRAIAMPVEPEADPPVACMPPFCAPVPGMGGGKTQIR